jgi:septal ring factor EnvC (AmiA/AmiB activator)
VLQGQEGERRGAALMFWQTKWMLGWMLRFVICAWQLQPELKFSQMNGPKDKGIAADIHTERSIVQEIEVACTDLEEEIAEMEQEASSILEELRTTVGDLSDLRYGRFTKAADSTDIGEDVIQSINRLKEVCGEAGYQAPVK